MVQGDKVETQSSNSESVELQAKTSPQKIKLQRSGVTKGDEKKRLHYRDLGGQGGV